MKTCLEKINQRHPAVPGWCLLVPWQGRWGSAGCPLALACSATFSLAGLGTASAAAPGSLGASSPPSALRPLPGSGSALLSAHPARLPLISVGCFSGTELGSAAGAEKG